MGRGHRMNNFEIGSLIGIPCIVEDGPFEDELLVQFESMDGTVSGFANRGNVREERGQHFLKGAVHSITGNILTIWVEGSFFTTNGLAKFSSENASHEFVSLAA